MRKQVGNSQIKNPKIDLKSNYAFTFLATLSGVAVGVLASVVMMGQVIHAEVASATDGLRSDVVALRTASADTFAGDPMCVGTSMDRGGSMAVVPRVAHAHVKAAHATIPTTSNNHGTMPSNNGQLIRQFVNSINSKSNGTIRDTGADSTNVIKSTNTNTTTITNTNEVHATNNNSQTAKSGSVNSEENTKAGQAMSGSAENTSETTMNFRIEN